MLVILSSFIYFIFSNKNFYCRKNFFVSIIFILLVFNFSKNIGINKSDFKNNPYIHIKEVGWYTPPVKMNLNNFEYYKGWIDNSPIGNKELIKTNIKNL